jgi:dynactin 1
VGVRSATTATTKANQENEAKIRLLEKKVQELRQKVSELQPQADKVERYDGIIQKLQSKAQGQFAEINDLKKQLKESESGFAQIETIQAEHDTNMEMAALDREMAEEKAEAYKAELDSIKSKLDELQLENEILRGENEELSKDMSPEERASQGWMQMQRENARLRDALIRLRDMTQEQEGALKEEIALLEEEVEELDGLKGEFDTTKTRLLESEAEAEDLREQLEAALGAETMIEQLTEKNMDMSAQIEELRNTVEDLESLKELNDEIELSHVEDKKQMQQEIDYKEALLIESARRVLSQDEELADRDYTIQRFRELVTNMQSDLEDMRSSKELTETQAQELGSHSRAMMDLNRQLQASASSTRVKTIEMELRRLEAQEAAEHLSIVQLFLPDAFQAERDSVLALLRFKRISFKATLLHGFMKERITSPSPHAKGDQLLAACDALDKLTWITAMCDRFTSCISTSTLPQFAKFESVLYELEPVERALNGYIENLRKDELRDSQVADGLQRAIAVMQHLSELHLHEGPESFADEVLMKTLLMQSNLETTAAALQIMKSGLLKAIPASEDGEDAMSSFAAKTDALAMQSRSGRVIVSKILRSLQDLKARSLALTPDSAPTFDAGADTTSELATSLRSLSVTLHTATHDEDGALVSTFTFADLMSAIRNFTGTQDSDVLAPLNANMRALHERLSDLLSVSTDLSNTLEFERPPTPWVLRSKALAESKAVSADAAAEISALKREVHERGTTIKLRDNALEEQGVKIELLESRAKDSAKKVSRIGELEKILEAAKRAERELERKIEEKTLLAARVEEERDEWARKAREMAATESAGGEGAKKRGAAGQGNLVGTSVEMDALNASIKTLESTIRHLRRQLHRSKLEENAQATSWLAQPLTLPPKPAARVAEERREGARKAFKALAELPLDAVPVVPGFVGKGEKGGRMGWKPRALTTRYQLFEAESAWLGAKELMSPEKRRVQVM